METLFTAKTLGSEILNLLQKGEIKILDLIQELRKTRKTLTKQAIYAKIRHLKSKNIVVTYHGYLALNLEWLKDLGLFLSLAQFHHMNPHKQSGHFRYLQPKESVNYTFTDLFSLDQFSNQVLYFLLEVHSLKEAFYAYDPHTWPYFLRPESEASLIEKARELKHPYYQLVAGKTKFDETGGEMSDNKHFYYRSAVNPLFKKTNYYVYCIGEFVVEIYLNQAMQSQIDDLYEISSKEGFVSLKDMKGKSRLIIRRDGVKAKKTAEKILKEFRRQGMDVMEEMAQSGKN